LVGVVLETVWQNNSSKLFKIHRKDKMFIIPFLSYFSIPIFYFCFFVSLSSLSPSRHFFLLLRYAAGLLGPISPPPDPRGAALVAPPRGAPATAAAEAVRRTTTRRA
jgi:hypothetical protein